MKNLIVTRADNNLAFAHVTIPLIQKYAERCNADFLIYDHNCADCPGNGRFHYRILKNYEMFLNYDRILSLDADILINKKCPDIFKVVPENYIGSVFEDKGSREQDRLERIVAIQQKFGNIGWERNYINTGVFITSKHHREIFKKINDEYWTGLGEDDVHIGYLIHKYGFIIYELSFLFNHMTMFSESWNSNHSRFDSFIIHYAGNGVFSEFCKNKTDQILYDFSVISEIGLAPR